MLRTLGRVLTGFVLACIAAGLVQVMFVETPKELASVPSSEFPEQARTALELSLLTATHFAIFSATFALIAAGIAEWLGVRGVAYWLAAGTGIALLGFTAQYSSEVAGQPSIFNNYALQAYLTAGFFGGLVYWLVAGKSSGVQHPDDPAIATPQPAGLPRIIVEKSERGGISKGSLAERLALKRAKTGSAEPALSKSPPAPSADDSAKAQTTSPGPATAVPVTKTDGAKSQAAAKPDALKDAPGK